MKRSQIIILLISLVILTLERDQSKHKNPNWFYNENLLIKNVNKRLGRL